MDKYVKSMIQMQKRFDGVLNPGLRWMEQVQPSLNLMGNSLLRALDLQSSALRPFNLAASSLFESQRWLKGLLDFQRLIPFIESRNQKLATFVEDTGWPPPAYMACAVLNEIVDSFESGKLSLDDIEEIFVHAHTPEVMAQIRWKWESMEWLKTKARIRILTEALLSYNDKRYFATVLTVLPQIEGLFGDALNKQPTPADAEAILQRSPFGETLADYYTDRILVRYYPWSSPDPEPELSRHAILHGCATDFGHQSTALKLIMFVDYLISAIDRHLAITEAKVEAMAHAVPPAVVQHEV